MRYLLLAVLLLTATVTAQVTPLPGTGCVGTTTIVGPSPRIGTTISITHQFPCNSPGAFMFAGFGLATATVPSPIPRCGGGACAFDVLPDNYVLAPITAQLSLTIPNNSALVGATGYAQAGCLFTLFGRCIQIDQAVQITVLP